jgi:tetrahydromethanopterin S-methyltransferase subunit B
MKYSLILVAILMVVGCKMPGVGELEERVDELETTAAYDDSDLVDRIEYVEDEMVILDQRVTSLETGEVAEVPHRVETVEDPARQEVTETPAEPLTVNMEDIPGLIDELNGMESAFMDSLSGMDGTVTEISAFVEELTLTVDSLSMENDSLRVRLDELEETVQDLSYAVNSLRTSTTSSSTGGRGSTTSSSTGGRGGTTSSTSSTTTTSTGGR